MSRSAIVMVVAGAILIGVAVVVFKHYWPAFALQSTLTKAILIGLTAYGALLAAVMIRRVVEPGLPMPILAWILAVLWLIAGALSAFNRTEDQHERDMREQRLRSDINGSSSSSFGKQGTGMGWALFLTFIALCMYGAGVGLTYWFSKKTLEAPVVATDTKPTPKPDKPADKPADTVVIPASTDIVEIGNLLQAVGFAAPKMSNDSEPSDGSKQVARWLAKKGTYSELAVAKNQTSLELVEKDPAKQRGNKLCIKGTLERIEKQTVDGTEVHAARIVTAQKDLLELYAVGKTGNLVKRKPATFCGVITGAQRDGRNIVPFAVGMFDTNK